MTALPQSTFCGQIPVAAWHQEYATRIHGNNWVTTMEIVNGRLRLVVSSKKVLVRVDGFDVSLPGLNGQLYVSKRTVKIFDYVLDDFQTRTVEEAREFARRSGLILEVIDLSRQSVFRRMIRRLGGRLEADSRRSLKMNPVEPYEKCEDIISPVSRP
jgi:hypothetical protein